MLHFSVFQRPVGTTGDKLLSFKVKAFHSLLVYGADAMYIGSGGVSSASGLELAAGGSFGLSHKDFNMAAVSPDDEISIDAVADVATTATIVLITSQ